MKICIVSDSHDRSAPLVEAIVEAQAAGAQVVIHCGDLIGVNTLRASLELGIPIHAVHGNNIGDVAALYRMMDKTGRLFTYHGQEAILELGGRRIFVSHMPHHARAFACTGDFDLVCHGHSHTAHVGRQADINGGQCWLVNPGSVAGIDARGVKAIPSWILGDLESMSFEIHTLQQPITEAYRTLRQDRINGCRTPHDCDFMGL
jgi:putative phosphoesterase